MAKKPPENVNKLIAKNKAAKAKKAKKAADATNAVDVLMRLNAVFRRMRGGS